MKTVTILAPEMVGSWMCGVADRCGTEAPYIGVAAIGEHERLSLEVMICCLQAVLGRVEKTRVWINGKKPFQPVS